MVCLAKFALSLHLLGISNALSSTYTLSEEYVGEEFLDLFGFEAIPDPTHGRVYVAQYQKFPGIVDGLIQ
jgi:hypothetical protein